MDINKVLAAEFKLRPEQIDNTVSLIDDGKTIPFIARYRKELTGSLDDQLLREIFDRLTYLRNLEKRKEEISSSIEDDRRACRCDFRRRYARRGRRYIPSVQAEEKDPCFCRP